MAIMVGGSQEDYERTLPLFKIMGVSYNLIGDIGSGNTCKLANQVFVVLNIAALSERHDAGEDGRNRSGEGV